VLTVDQYQLLWNGEVVYENADRNGSIAFMFFKDGVGEITVHSSVTATELDQFVDILKQEIHNPSPDSDIVTRLWKADFAHISYRVLDEDPLGEADGERGGGARSRTATLEADDLSIRGYDQGVTDDESTASIADYLLGVVKASRPTATPVEAELFIQDTLATLFCASANETRGFSEELGESERSDKIAMLLGTALDFVTGGSGTSMVENSTWLAQRAVGFAKDEGNPRTLTRLLALTRWHARDSIGDDAKAVLQELETVLVDPDFLRSLGTNADMPTEEVLGVVHYGRQIGAPALPVLREMLGAHQKPVVHREVCEALLALVEDGVGEIVDTLDLDDPLMARDVIYLLRRAMPGTLPPIVKELVHYPDVQVRDGALYLLSEGGYDEASALLVVLLDDPDAGIRRRALAALEGQPSPAAVHKLISLCFDDEDPARDDEERMQLFETAGRIAPREMVERLGQVLKKRTWHRLGRRAGKSDRLFAVAALAHAGPRGRSLLKELSHDPDAEVREKAEGALAAKPHREGGE